MLSGWELDEIIDNARICTVNIKLGETASLALSEAKKKSQTQQINMLYCT